MIILDPHLVNGLVEAQGCFNVEINTIKKNKKVEIVITPSFFILQGNIAREIMKALPAFFKQDQTRIRKPSKASPLLRYETKRVDDLLENVCSHFDQYPLLSEKRQDYLFFKQVLKILQKEKKLTKNRLLEILDIIYQMNLSSANDKSSKTEAKEYWLEIIEANY